MKTVHIFFRLDPGIDDALADMSRQWSLHQNSVKTRVTIQFLQDGQQLGFIGSLGEYMCFGINSQGVAGLFFSADINFRSRDIPHTYKRKAWLNAARY